MTDMTTTDFAQFGWRERQMALEILKEWQENGLPSDFYDEGVTFMMNRYSGNVFLTNSEFEVAMMNSGKLESFYNSPYEGKEGFFEDLLEEYPEMHPEDQEWFQDIAKTLNKEDELPNVEDDSVLDHEEGGEDDLPE